MLYHVETAGPDIEGFRTGLANAIKIAMDNGCNQVAIAVHGKTNLSGVISDAIGEAAVNLLQKNGSFQFEGVTIHLMTERIKSGLREGVILATHASTKYLNKLLTDRRATDVVFVPWAPEEFEEYVANNESIAI